MMQISPVPMLALLAPLLGALSFTEPPLAQAPGDAKAGTPPPATYPALPSEMPVKFVPTNDGFDHVRRDVMIPMRDGVKLHTVILVPKGALGAKGAPIS